MTHVLYIGSAQLVNVTLGFVVVLAATLLVMRIAPTDSLKKWCLCLPIVKALSILVAGVPAGAYVISPYAGQRWELGSFQLGLGLERPLLLPRFTGRLAALKSDEWYGLSVGDGVTHFFVTRGWGALPLFALGVVAVVSLVRAGSHLFAWRRLCAHERADRAAARSVAEHTVLGRRIAVLVRANDQPTAVNGALSPVIWLSRAVAQAKPEIRQAAIEHELSHVRHGDVILFAGLSLFRALFWFLPGMGGWSVGSARTQSSRPTRRQFDAGCLRSR